MVKGRGNPSTHTYAPIINSIQQPLCYPPLAAQMFLISGIGVNMIKPCTTHYIEPFRVCFESDEVLLSLKEMDYVAGLGDAEAAGMA